MRYSRLPRGIRRLFRLPAERPEEALEEVDEEIRLHLRLRVQQLIAEGYPAEAAQAEAERRFGTLDVERARLRTSAQHRDARMHRFERAAELWQDLRYAWRGMHRAPGFAALVIATLAIGIGAATGIFSVINGVLLRPLPYPEPDRIAAIYTQWRELGADRGNLSMPELADVAALPTFEQVAAYGPGETTIGAAGSTAGEPERLPVLHVTANLFDVLRTPAQIGRVFTPEEDRVGQDRVAVLGHGYWQRRFGGDPAVIGKVVVTDGSPRVITGVMPPGFAFGNVELYLPLALDPAAGGSSRGAHNYQSIARLSPGATHAKVDAQLAALTTRLRRDYPASYPGTGFSIHALALHTALVGDVTQSLSVLGSVVGLLLLIACANAANLLLLRAEGRHRELAVRAALGAGRSRIARQLLTESVLLALLAGAIGLALGSWAVRALLAVNPEALPRHQAVQLDPTVVAVALALSLGTGVIFGMLPSLQASRADLQGLLRGGGRTDTAQRGSLRRSLVVGQLALSMVVVVAAGLLLRSFSALRGVDAGMDPQGVLTFSTSLPSARHPGDRVASTYEGILERLRALPGVEAAGAMGLLPLAVTGWNWDIIVEGRPVTPGEGNPSPRPQVITPGALEAMRIALVRGRGITPADRADAPLVALVNETMARTVWPGVDPLGKRFRMAGDSTQWATVVGVVKDVRSGGLREAPIPEFHVPYAQFRGFARWTMRRMTIAVRTTGDPSLLAAPARRALADVDPELAVADVRTMRQVVDRSVAQPRFMMLLLSAFGAAALLLASIGVYGVISYGVAQRTREFGIRVALGARWTDVVRLVLRQGLGLAGIGVCIGLIGALFATRALRSLLFEVSTTDPATFAAITLLLLGVATTASLIPARRATRADPTTALRAE